MIKNGKMRDLKLLINSYRKLAVAFSGGVDSTFLLKAAHDVLKDNVIAITLNSIVFPKRELDSAVDITKQLNVRHIIIEADIMNVPGFRENSANRCYLCKKYMFELIRNEAAENGIVHIVDGTNTDDCYESRPGMKALEELGILSPLKTTGIFREEIRMMSKGMKLPTKNKPSLSCLAARIPDGHEITEKKLIMVDKAEEYLVNHGLRQVRVRHYGNLAKIEVPVEDIYVFFSYLFMKNVIKEFKMIGFERTALDLAGYGS
jgi:pyridinium-3,5-biscarboxylic acid mononucleotide sulfurtransferase